jgi:type IV pilus assembly protein PilV
MFMMRPSFAAGHGRRGSAARGASLIEVLVALLILSFGMLAMAGLHAAAFRYGKMSQFRGVATQLATEMADRMRANVDGAMAGNYVHEEAYDSGASAVTVPACANPAECTPAEIAEVDLAQMLNTVRLALPGGGLYVERDAAQPNAYNVWVLWLDPEAHGNDEQDDSASLSGLCPEGAGVSSPRPQCMPVRVVL